MLINKILELDRYLFNLIYNFGLNNFLISDFKVFLAKYFSYFLFFILLYFIFIIKINKKIFSFKNKLFFLIESILAIILSRGILTELINFLGPIIKPAYVLGIKSLVYESNFGLPSGHDAFFFSLATILFFWDKKLGIIFFILSFFNSVVLISAGIHIPIDIFIGIFIGILSACMVHLFLNIYLKNEYSRNNKS